MEEIPGMPDVFQSTRPRFNIQLLLLWNWQPDVIGDCSISLPLQNHMFFEMSWTGYETSPDTTARGLQLLASTEDPIDDLNKNRRKSCCVFKIIHSQSCFIRQNDVKWGGFSSRCIIGIYCYNQSGVHPTVFPHFWDTYNHSHTRSRSHTHTHTCIHHNAANQKETLVFFEKLPSLSRHGSKLNPPLEMTKNCNRPRPWARFHFID